MVGEASQQGKIIIIGLPLSPRILVWNMAMSEDNFSLSLTRAASLSGVRDTVVSMPRRAGGACVNQEKNSMSARSVS